ncbi:MAG: dipeptide epimerase [Ruminococcaceae bacterium]|nr:dipeptide epimerase [Oscillospiraceae bacterium]
MKIVDILTKKVSFRRKKVFKIAFTANIESQCVYVKILTDEGIYGLGEATPFPLVTSETVDGVIASIEFMKSELLGADPTDIAKIHEIMDKTLLNNTSAKAAIDIACYDIMGKKAGKPVHKLIGAKTDSVQTDMTIGIDSVENMVKEAVERVEEGFRILKIKCGIDPQKDIEVVKQIRKAVGDDIDLRIDANQGYDKNTALYVLGEISKYNITEAEQPLPFWDVHSMAEINKVSPVPIMADESVHTPIQAEIACQHDACKIVNIKLMKCGGIYPALQIADIAKKYGKTCLVGCFYESKLAISAAAAVVLAKDNIESADLDSFFSFVNSQNGVCGGFEVDKDILKLSSKSGYGFEDYEF